MTTNGKGSSGIVDCGPVLPPATAVTGMPREQQSNAALGGGKALQTLLRVRGNLLMRAAIGRQVLDSFLFIPIQCQVRGEVLLWGVPTIDASHLAQTPPPAHPRRACYRETTVPTTYTIAILDTETTGLSPSYDRVVEVFVQRLLVDSDGHFVDFAGHYHSLHDPGRPIPREATQVHGITTAMVRGHRIDDRALGEVLAGAHLVVAHNSGFDKGFVRQHVPTCDELLWGCSCRGIPWRVIYPQLWSTSLPELARALRIATGTAHRAQGDVETTCRLLLQPGPDGAPHLRHLLRKKLKLR